MQAVQVYRSLWCCKFAVRLPFTSIAGILDGGREFLGRGNLRLPSSLALDLCVGLQGNCPSQFSVGSWFGRMAADCHIPQNGHCHANSKLCPIYGSSPTPEGADTRIRRILKNQKPALVQQPLRLPSMPQARGFTLQLLELAGYWEAVLGSLPHFADLRMHADAQDFSLRGSH